MAHLEAGISVFCHCQKAPIGGDRCRGCLRGELGDPLRPVPPQGLACPLQDLVGLEPSQTSQYHPNIIPISSQYHPNIIPISSNIPNIPDIPNILPPSKLLQASRPSTPQVHSFSSENLNTSQFFACGAAVSVTWAKTLSAASSMAAPSKAFDFSGCVMTRVWDSLGRCQYKTDHYLANRSCVAEHMFKPNRFGISNLFGNVWSLLLNVVNIVS